MAAELKVALSQVRSSDDKEEIMEKWNELSVYDIGEFKLKIIMNILRFFEILMYEIESYFK